eukprot:Gb_10823 [translate_table: standard]
MGGQCALGQTIEVSPIPIMSYYDDYRRGMVESAFEFVHTSRKLEFHDFVFLLKESNPVIMIQAYRLLVSGMYIQGWDYPLHWVVTGVDLQRRRRLIAAEGLQTLDASNRTSEGSDSFCVTCNGRPAVKENQETLIQHFLLENIKGQLQARAKDRATHGQSIDNFRLSFLDGLDLWYLIDFCVPGYLPDAHLLKEHQCRDTLEATAKSSSETKVAIQKLELIQDVIKNIRKFSKVLEMTDLLEGDFS